MRRKVAIIGKGNVGSALKRGLERARYDVHAVGKDAVAVRQAAEWGEILILAVPYRAIDATLVEMGGAATGKVVVDATNALTADGQLALGFSTSAAEELQRKLPHAKVVKAFNTVLAQQMDTGRMADQPITALVAGEDVEAKAQVIQLARDIGFDGVDAGPLKNARWLEAMAFLNIQLAYTLGMGTHIGFRLVR
jgi:8-hydroxy-5-deazaflavin:NADPH oxidoreductase